MMHRATRILAPAIALAFILGACSSSDGAEQVTAESSEAEELPVHTSEPVVAEAGLQTFDGFSLPATLETAEPLAIAVGEDFIEMVAVDGSRSILITRPRGMADPEGPLYAAALYEPLSALEGNTYQGLPANPLESWLGTLGPVALSHGSTSVIAGGPSDAGDFTVGATPVENATGGEQLALLLLADSVVTVEPEMFYRMRIIPHPDGDLFVLINDPELQARPGETTTWSDTILRPMDLG